MKKLFELFIRSNVMSSKLFRQLVWSVMLVVSSLPAMADIIVIYRQGFPDTTAPAQILERKLGARMVSCLDSDQLEKIQEEGNYNQVITFDTFLEPDKLENLKNELLKLDPSTKLIVYVKKGDTAYDKLPCDEKTDVDFQS